MTERRESINEVIDHTIVVRIVRRGHERHIPFGSLVRCVYPIPVYESLDGWPERGKKLCIDVSRIAIVVATGWHVDELELVNAEFGPGPIQINVKNVKPYMRKPTMYLWYKVQYIEGCFWVRYDWLEVVLDHAI